MVRAPDYLIVGKTPLRPPEDRPWGMRELYVWDPNGNLRRFGERRSVPA